MKACSVLGTASEHDSGNLNSPLFSYFTLTVADCSWWRMAGVPGFEPGQIEPESKKVRFLQLL